MYQRFQKLQYQKKFFLVYKINAEGDCPPYPIKCYASEWSGDVGEGEGPGVTYLGSFTEELQQPFNVHHINYG